MLKSEWTEPAVKIVLSRPAKKELEWWAKKLATCEGQSMFESDPIMSIRRHVAPGLGGGSVTGSAPV
jgi:hypothetical protein